METKWLRKCVASLDASDKFYVGVADGAFKELKAIEAMIQDALNSTQGDVMPAKPLMPRKYEETSIRETSEKYIDVRLAMEDVEFVCENLPKSDPLFSLLAQTYNNVRSVSGCRRGLISMGTNQYP